MTHRRYRRSKKEPGLLEIAATSDWKVSAGMAAACAFAAAVVIPILFGGSRVFGMLAILLSAVAWMMFAAFALISIVRFVKKTRETTSPPRQTESSPQPGSSRHPPPLLSGRDRELMGGVFTPDAAALVTSEPRPTTWSFDVIHRMDWKRFEDLCCEFYREKGIRADTTTLGADGGVDIRLCQDATDPVRCTAVVQCKAWNQATGVKPIRELRGVMAHEGIAKAFFMAPAGFTTEARAFATANRITLIDGTLFLAMLTRLPEVAQMRLLAFATEGQWTTPSCPSCGVKMTPREGSRGKFWGCVGYPRCRSTLPMRAARA